VDRRRFLVTSVAAALAAPLDAEAQVAHRVYRVGFLGITSLSDHSGPVAALRDGLREAGYYEGANLAIEYRWAEGKPDSLPGLATDLVRLKVSHTRSPPTCWRTVTTFGPSRNSWATGTSAPQ
jgi:putative tryptophan/tyrosine transport system substrate-binding protein